MIKPSPSNRIQQPTIGGIAPSVGFPILTADLDLGPVSGGVSNARQVRCENGEEYIIKSRNLSPSNSYIAGNEYIAARLTEILELPILDSRIVRWHGNLHFASRWMHPNTHDSLPTPDKISQCSNSYRVYDMAVFDVWLCNVDRHRGNIVMRLHPRPDGSVVRTLLFNDHSHCLLAPGRAPHLQSTTVHDLGNLAKTGFCSSVPPHDTFFRARIIEHLIEDVAMLREALDRVAAIPNHAIKSVVSGVPPDFIPTSDRAGIENFLLNRRKALKQIFRNELAFFKNLSGGPL